MSNAFHKSDGTVLGTALWNWWVTTLWCVLLLLGLPTLPIRLQVSQLLNALVLIRDFHHRLQSERHVRVLRLGRRAMVVDKTKVVELPVRQVGVEAFKDIPWTVANTNRNNTEWNGRSLNDGLNRCRLLRYLAIGDDDEDMVLARLADIVHCFPDDRRQTGRTAQRNSTHHFIVQL